MNEKKSRSGLYRIALFLGLFLFGTTIHYILRPTIGPVINRDLNAKVAAKLINTLTPSANVDASGSRLGAPGAYVQVAQGCEGVDVILMVIAALIAFPMTRLRRALGIALGVFILYGANLLRISGLWYCLRHQPELFETMHLIVGQSILIVIALGFFVGWTGMRTSLAMADAR